MELEIKIPSFSYSVRLLARHQGASQGDIY